MRTLAVLVLSLAASACTSALGIAGRNDTCRFTADRTALLAVGGASQAKIIARAGSLKIQGRPDISEVRVRGEACASRQDLLDKIELVAEERSGMIFIEAKLPESAGWLGNDALLNLEIEAPTTLAFDVEDGSGSVSVREVASLRLRDGSGSIDVEGVTGDVFVQDGSGGIQVKAVGGNVEIKDGSGGLSVANVAGSVDVHDSSGGLSITDVEQSVTVEDSSGGIRVSRVAGDVTVTRDGSGGISVSEIQGNFTVERDGSGGVHYDKVEGRVSVSD